MESENGRERERERERERLDAVDEIDVCAGVVHGCHDNHPCCKTGNKCRSVSGVRARSSGKECTVTLIYKVITS